MNRQIFLALAMTLNILYIKQKVETAEILGIFANPIGTHSVVFQTLMTELSKRDHNVTVLTSYSLKINPHDFNQILIQPYYSDFWEEALRHTNLKPQEFFLLSEVDLQATMNIVGINFLNHFLSNPETQKLMKKDKNFSYDLIIIDIFYTEALLTFGYIHNCPIIGLAALNFENYMKNLLDYTVPSACSPIDFNFIFDDIGFWKRIENIYKCLNRRKIYSNILEIQENQIMKKNFANFEGEIPTIMELLSRISILLFNDYIPMQLPKPSLLNQIPIGGLHIRPAQILPWNIKRFLDDARIGSIYINLGNILKCSHIPKDQLNAILNTIGKLKERVLWKCDDKFVLQNLPSNLMLQNNIPNTDILAHPHVNYCIIDGDLISIQETLHRNVPLLGIPIFRDQDENMDAIEKLGIGIKLSFFNFTEKSFSSVLHTLMNEPKYHNNIRELSTIFRDRPLGALETAIYWIEYVLRHNGATYIHTNGMNISWNHLYLLDLLFYGFIISILFVIFLFIVYRVLMKTYQKHQTNKLYAKLS